MNIINDPATYRKMSQPFASREEASQVARQLQNRVQIQTTIVQK